MEKKSRGRLWWLPLVMTACAAALACAAWHLWGAKIADLFSVALKGVVIP